MKTLFLLAAILMVVSAPALAQQKYTCRDVRSLSCADLRAYAYLHGISNIRQAAIARACRVTHCLAQ
jgi:hypothetical protein